MKHKKFDVETMNYETLLSSLTRITTDQQYQPVQFTDETNTYRTSAQLQHDPAFKQYKINPKAIKQCAGQSNMNCAWTAIKSHLHCTQNARELQPNHRRHMPNCARNTQYSICTHTECMNANRIQMQIVAQIAAQNPILNQ